MAPTDPARPLLDAWVSARAACYAREGRHAPAFSEWGEIDSAALRALRQDGRWFTIVWNESHEDVGLGRFSVAGGLQMTLCVEPGSESPAEFFGFGNYEEFGAWMRARAIAIRSDDDARRVWEAFCDLHRKGWKGQPLERVGEGIWHLGVNDIDGVRYFYEVRVDPQGIVQSGKLLSRR